MAFSSILPDRPAATLEGEQLETKQPSFLSFVRLSPDVQITPEFKS
jgi:hypothetical protein